jgi:hypothetical protein
MTLAPPANWNILIIPIGYRVLLLRLGRSDLDCQKALREIVMVRIAARLYGLKKCLFGVTTFALGNVVVSATLFLTSGLVHAEYYGPPETYSGTTNDAGVLSINYKNRDSYQNLSDLRAR